MTDRLLFAAFLVGVLILPWTQGSPPQPPKNFADPKWDCPLLFGDWPETYDCLPEKSE